MEKDDRDILELLYGELDFIEKGGYGRSVRTPWKDTSIFQDSITCINFRDPEHSLPCSQCLLIDFVSPELREMPVPCHQIPLNEANETIEDLGSRTISTSWKTPSSNGCLPKSIGSKKNARRKQRSSNHPEFGVLKLRGLSLADYFGTRDPVSGTVYYLTLVLFALMPLLVRRKSDQLQAKDQLRLGRKMVQAK